MHNTTLALSVLALFTTAERAAEIEGDLLEQARGNKFWFWWQVKLTCIALFFHGLRQEPGKILLFSYAIYELVFKFGWWVLGPVRRGIARELDLRVSEMPLTNTGIDVVFAFAVGMLLVRLLPKYSGQIVFLVIGLALGRVALLRSIPEAAVLVPLMIVPGLAGMLLMKWVDLRRLHGNDTGFRPTPE